MRAELESLRVAQGMVEEGLARADEEGRLPVDVGVAERRVGRMMREWQAGRPEAPESVVQKVVGLKYPWWAYPTTAAAAVLLAFLVWWGNTPARPYGQPVAQNLPGLSTVPQGSLADDQQQQAEEEPVTAEAQLAEDLELSFSHPSREGLRAAEGELVALSRVADEADSADEWQQQDVNQ
jgi:hypothetical protein